MPLPPQPPTPYVAVDLDRLDRNVTAMAEAAAHRGLALLPHAKTHKSPDLAGRQLAAGAAGLTVATVAEAEVFAEAGCTDLFLAYPLWVDRAKGVRIRRLLERARLTVGTDSLEAADALAAQLGPDRGRVPVLVEVDSGHHRTGVPPEAAGELADRVAHTGLDVAGVFTYPGHSYRPGGREEAAAQEAAALAVAASALRGRGIVPRVVSGGSSPTATVEGYDDALTQLRPGVYVFNDAQQLELGACTLEEIALWVVGTVVSTAGGRVVLDSGSKALGADRPAWVSGHGRLLDHPQATVGLLSEHHAVVTWPEHTPHPPLGTRLRVVPNHVCTAVNLADELVVVRDAEVLDRWPVAARGANT